MAELPGPSAARSTELPRVRAHYVLLCRLDSETVIRIGSLGEVDFRAGFYAYVGSALGGLAGRLRRHLGPPARRPRWHIDRLLQHARPLGAVWSPAEEGKECPLAEVMARRLPRILRFGSTDCRCPGHLFYGPRLNDLRDEAWKAFRSAGRKPGILWR